MGVIPDAELVRFVQTGSESALEEIYRRYLPSIWRYVYTQLRGNQNTSEDIVSEIFLAAVSGLNKLDPDQITLKAWLMGIARHKVADHWRDNKRLQAIKEKVSQKRNLALPQNSQQQKFSNAKDNRVVVTEVMSKLKDSDRQVLEWKYLDNLYVRQMAQFMDKTEKAVENQLYRARQNFHLYYRSITKIQTGETLK